ncbi:MAG: mismatch repair protein MutS [Planctomycetota bacterium]
MQKSASDSDATVKSSGAAMTPMMEQFWRAKKEQPDALLFFRMGDFYELFHDDAKLASRELGITLTARSKGEDAIPMAGVPVRTMESYLMRLVQKGHKVAICEQLQDPRHTKGMVDRGIVRVVTAGTITEEDVLNARENNYLVALHTHGNRAGLAWVDLSTGRMMVSEIELERISEELARIAPAELLCSLDLEGREPGVWKEITALLGPRLSTRDPWCFERDASLRALKKHFRVSTLEGFGIEDDSTALPAAGALMDYVEATQRSACEHILRIEPVDPARHLVLDRATRSCLELFRTQRDGRREGTLIDTIDATLTPMGGRMLHEWLSSPLREKEPILARQQAIRELVDAPFLREELRELFGSVLDIERLVAKISTGRAHARDLIGLCRSLEIIAPVRAKLDSVWSERLAQLREELDPLEDVVSAIRDTLAEDPPLTLREGGLIRAGVHQELDELRGTAGMGKDWMARLQAAEIERTGIATLKVGFNSVFGYYIEIPNSQSGRVPPEYIRKQTVKNAERYITPELKEYENKVLNSEERANDLEYELFSKLRDSVAREIPRILKSAQALAQLDTLSGLAQRAVENRYVAPEIDDGDLIKITDGRHPVVERNPRAEAFVPNDSRLNRTDRMITVITGPNMAGKSTYIRQTALIVLLAQIGSFVPAGEAKIGLVDRIFTRIGSADDIGRNASTFMVEMIEIANILNNASARSLVVLDEVGRGTSTFDGLALAWAIVEHLHEVIRARTLFATHYHQLTDLQTRLKGVCNLNVAVREWNDEIVFLHKMVEGGTDRSYGIHVARLAGVPRELLERAKRILADIEEGSEGLAPRIANQGKPKDLLQPQQLGLFETSESRLAKELAKVDIDRTTPIEALLLLRKLKQMR